MAFGARVRAGFAWIGAGLLFACSAQNDSNSVAGGAGGQTANGAGGALAGSLGLGGAASGGGPSAGAGAGTSGAAGSASLGPCSPPVRIDAPSAKLSQTGCMDAAHPTSFAAVVIPYELNSPLWSDSADKARGMVLPPGGKIHVKDCAAEPALCPQGSADSGRWVFPVGTVMLKNFSFDGKLVETRLFARFSAKTWVGYSYAWDEAQSDATLVPDDRVHASFNTGTRTVDWNFPNRIDCVKCHNDAAGGVLGPETRQMNREVGGQNQLDRLQSLGAFDAPLAKPYPVAFALPYAGQLGTPSPSATLEQKARSYLHANCAYCHRPDGDFPNIDLRYDVTLKDTQICGATPAKGDQGVDGALLLAPGKPELSSMYLRMTALLAQNGRMPQIATAVVDQDGSQLVKDWITSIQACP